MRHLRLLLLLLPLALDVAGNFLCAVGAALWRSLDVLRKASRETLSATAWSVREHKVFGWTHRFIDWMPWFGKGHCQAQYEREQRFGGVWAAWRDDFAKAQAESEVGNG